jgi:bifunctional DNase/RNase
MFKKSPRPWRANKFRFEKFLPLLLVLLAVETALLVYFWLTRPPTLPDIWMLPQLSTVGYVQVDVQADIVAGRGRVRLTGDCWQITAMTEPGQADSIRRGLEGVIPFRPGSHDLMVDAFRHLGIEVVMAKVIDLRENTYIGRLILVQGGTILSLDSRPSDATAIAVRAGAPVYVKEELLKSHGRWIC